ncbi:MAG: EF-Tu/IF-2/RF-3 family GTPase [Mycobacterium sp.]
MFRMTVRDVFVIRNRGAVATGHVESGQVNVGDEVRINDGPGVRVDGIEAFRKVQQAANLGDDVGLLFRTLGAGDVSAGDVITSSGVFLV